MSQDQHQVSLQKVNKQIVLRQCKMIILFVDWLLDIW